MSVPIQAIRIESEWNGTALPAQHWITIHLLNRAAHIEVRVSAPHYGDPPAPDGPVGPTDQLWEHEVVELFIYGANDQYTEIELAPSGHHLVLQLQGTRNVMKTRLPIEYEATIHAARWTGTAKIDKALLPPGPHRWNATAIHGSDAKRTYLSWNPLPGEAPDFHQAEHTRPLSFLREPPSD